LANRNYIGAELCVNLPKRFTARSTTFLRLENFIKEAFLAVFYRVEPLHACAQVTHAEIAFTEKNRSASVADR
jgi:hypothetical protein